MNIDNCLNNLYFCREKREQKFPLFNLGKKDLPIILEKVKVLHLKKIEEKIKSLLATKFEEEEFNSCFLVEIIQNNKKLQVFIDSDKGISFGTCARISRYLEAYLDESSVLGEKYVLEVSSPGADKPVKMLRQLSKHIGRKLQIRTKEDTEFKVIGKLVSINDSGFELEIKEKKKDAYTTEYKFEDIYETKIVISF